MTAPRIDRFAPTAGWPGTVIEIEGEGFLDALDDNEVVVGGERALVVRAAVDRLTVLCGAGTQAGTVEVTVGGSTAVSDVQFERAEWPDVRQSARPGPPVFFSGPQRGTPKLLVQDQPVLVILAHGQGAAPADPAAQRAFEENAFNAANRFWREASYGRTSFAFDFVDSVELPRVRNDYVWDQRDVEWARLQLLLWTKRHAVADGNRLLVTHQGFRLSTFDITPGAPFEQASVTNLGVTMHVARKGSTAYVASGTDGVFVMDVSGAAPTVVRQLAVDGHALACDVDGDLLVVATLEEGIHVFNVSDPPNPAFRVKHATADWATAVRVVGSRAYVGVGTNVVCFDLSNPSAPTALGSAPAGGWVMGLDVEGSTCVAATDGRGLATFDVSGGPPVHRGRELGALNLHAVELVGTTAYAAAGAQGLHVVDVSDLASPRRLKTVATTRPCYAVAISGAFAWLGIGGKVMVDADISDPANPRLGSIEHQLTGTFLFGGDPDVGALRQDIKNASDSHGKLKTDGLFIDAIQAAALPPPGVDPFKGLCVVLHGFPGRGASQPKSQVTENDRTIAFTPDAKGLIWLASNAHWGRIAHEIGHWFGMPDNYEEEVDDGTLIKGDAANWCMSGNHDLGPLFAAKEADRMSLYDSSNVVRRRWNPAAGASVEPFVVVAHGTDENGGDRVHLVELVVANGLSYWIEARRRPGGTVFDGNIPLPVPTPNPPGRVLVTRVTESTTINNSSERQTMLFGVLDVGEEVVDAARLLRISVDELVATDPLTYRVSVHWNEEPPPDPKGKFDLSITPWDTKTWESVDIWVNSVRNDSGSVVYETFEGTDPSIPRLNGDRPWVKRRNTVHARIRNTGVQDVEDVYATCYLTSPPGIGDNGSWVTLESKHVPLLPANSDVVVEFEWVPKVDTHTCISVAVMPKFGEIQPRNNRAQENVANFDSAGSSSHEPVILEAEVRSPFSVPRRVDLRVADLPKGWHAVVEPAWVWLRPKGAAPVRVVIWTELHAPGTEFQDVPDEAFPRIEGWTDFDHRYIPIGGILAPVRANAHATIFVEIGVSGREVDLFAEVSPNAAVPVSVEVTDASGSVQRFGRTTGANGRMRFSFSLEPGRYSLQAFTASTRKLAEAESDVHLVEII